MAGTATDRRFALTRYLLTRSSEEDRGEFSYSNAGYAIAGAVAERVTVEGWKTLIQTRLFETFGMEASFGWPALGEPGEPWGHWEVNGVLTPHDPNDPYQLLDLIRPAGDVNASLGEYVKFLPLHIHGLQERDSFLSVAGFRKLHQPIGSYALGWDVGDADGSRLSLHFGSAGTFHSVAAMAPDLDLGIVVFTNAGRPRAKEALEVVGNELIATWAQPD